MGAARICRECGEGYGEAQFCDQDGATLIPTGADPLLGRSLQRWRITRLIGAGAAGRVYRAVQPQIGGRVAIKVLSHQAAEDRDSVQRFFAEARTVNLIRHENIVNILALAELEDGRPYIVMELLEGASLADVMAQAGPLPLGGLALVVGDVLSALRAAHRKGVVHRDLKPANIFVTPAGRAKVLDFGLAKLDDALDARHVSTKTGLLLGTPQYMAPEQAASRPVDARTDLYAVGVILYEGITGRRPFEADALFDLLRKHVEEEPVPPRELRPEGPPALEAVVLAAMAKAPAQRFGSAREMLAALAEATEGLPREAWRSLGRGGGYVQGATLRKPLGSDDSAATLVDPGASHRATRRRAIGRVPLWLAGAALFVLVTTVVALVFVRPRPGDVAEADAGGMTAVAPAADAAPEAEVILAEAAPPDAAPARAVAADAPLPRKRRGGGGSVTVERVAKTEDRLPTRLPDPAKDPAAPRTLPGPPSPDRFDLVAFLPEARKLARRVYGDAELVMMFASGVREDGTMDMTARGSAGYMFRSPSRSAPETRCYVRVWIHARSIELGAILPASLSDPCAWPTQPPPRCHPRTLWKAAQREGAPTGEKAYVRYTRQKWEFSVLGNPFESTFTDDC